MGAEDYILQYGPMEVAKLLELNDRVDNLDTITPEEFASPIKKSLSFKGEAPTTPGSTT